MERTHEENIHKRIDHVLCAKTCVQMEHSKMQTESNEYTRETTVSSHTVAESTKLLESYFDEHGKEVWERHWMGPEVPATFRPILTRKTKCIHDLRVFPCCRSLREA